MSPGARRILYETGACFLLLMAAHVFFEVAPGRATVLQAFMLRFVFPVVLIGGAVALHQKAQPAPRDNGPTASGGVAVDPGDSGRPAHLSDTLHRIVVPLRRMGLQRLLVIVAVALVSLGLFGLLPWWGQALLTTLLGAAGLVFIRRDKHNGRVPQIVRRTMIAAAIATLLYAPIRTVAWYNSPPVREQRAAAYICSEWNRSDTDDAIRSASMAADNFPDLPGIRKLAERIEYLESMRRKADYIPGLSAEAQSLLYEMNGDPEDRVRGAVEHLANECDEIAGPGWRREPGHVQAYAVVPATTPTPSDLDPTPVGPEDPVEPGSEEPTPSRSGTPLPFVLGGDGLGAVRFGQPRKAVVAAVVKVLGPSDESGPSVCAPEQQVRWGGLSLYFQRGLFSSYRLGGHDLNLTTGLGVGVRSTVEELRRAYGGRARIHDDGTYAVFWNGKPVLFGTITDGRIAGIAAGALCGHY